MTHMTTPQLIRALGGADAICREGCTCRGSYGGPERRSVARHATAADVRQALGPAAAWTDVNAIVAELEKPCPAAGCDLFGPHELHEDADGFRWRQRP